MLAQIRTPSEATLSHVHQLKVTFIECERHVSPPGLEPWSLENMKKSITGLSYFNLSLGILVLFFFGVRPSLL